MFLQYDIICHLDTLMFLQYDTICHLGNFDVFAI